MWLIQDRQKQPGPVQATVLAQELGTDQCPFPGIHLQTEPLGLLIACPKGKHGLEQVAVMRKDQKQGHSTCPLSHDF
jgi:hypothetical protein